MHQIASQTGDLLRQKRFVAGRGAAGGWSEAEVCAEELADPRMPVWHHREEVATPRQNVRLRGRTFDYATGRLASLQNVRLRGGA